MTQYINLYDESLRPRRELLALNNLLVGAALVLVLLGLLAAWGMSRSSRELQAYRQAEMKLREAQEQLSLFAAQAASRRPDPKLEQALQATRAKLQSRQQILARLRQGEFGATSGFAPLLQGLARVPVDGVWLTGFEANANGQRMVVRGRLLGEGLLPRYVAALSLQPAFAGREFSALDIKRIDAQTSEAGSVPAHVEFTLSAGPAKAAGGTP